MYTRPFKLFQLQAPFFVPPKFIIANGHISRLVDYLVLGSSTAQIFWQLIHEVVWACPKEET